MPVSRWSWKDAPANDRVMVVGVVLAGALLAAWGCARVVDTEPSADPSPTSTPRPPPTTADDGIAAEERYDRTTTTTRAVDVDSLDFDNCKLLNNTILSVSDDYYAGEVDAHTGLSSIRVALETMEALDCGRFSPVIAREMADMDRSLRSVGY